MSVGDLAELSFNNFFLSKNYTREVSLMRYLPAFIIFAEITLSWFHLSLLLWPGTLKECGVVLFVCLFGFFWTPNVPILEWNVEIEDLKMAAQCFIDWLIPWKAEQQGEEEWEGEEKGKKRERELWSAASLPKWLTAKSGPQESRSPSWSLHG